jgi:UDP-glucose 4-epimerase
MAHPTIKHILVTGGAGFIGSHVAEAFLAEGYQVSIIDNLSTGQLDYIPKNAQFFQADITDRQAMHRLIATLKPDAIDHHAAHIQVGNSVKDPQFDATANILGLLNIMEAAKEVGVQKVLMASTGGAMYGNKPTPFTEDLLAEPVSPYGVSKRSGELYLNYYHEQYGIPYTALRYANVYGPRQNPHGESGVVAIFSEMIAAGKAPVINGDGTHTRDYVQVRDVARANVLALESEYVGELNIGTAREISTNEVFRAVVAEFGATIPEEHGPERPGEQVTSAISPAKAKEVLGWEPEVSFEEGVAEVVSWYKEKN